MVIKKQHKAILMSLFIMINVCVLSQSISIDVNVPVAFTVLAPLIAGDPMVTPYENIMGDIDVTPDGGNKWAFGKTWYVTVGKSTASWHSTLLLDVCRDPTATKVINGVTYVQIPDDPTAIYFFESNNTSKVMNLDLQHRVRISGGGPPAAVYTTTITYTIVDM